MIQRTNSPRAPIDRAHAPSTPITPALDETLEEPWYDGDDAIVALREYDSEDEQAEHELPLNMKSFRGGASRECEVWVPGRGLSGMHFLLERRGRQLLLHDQHSTHGVVHAGRKTDAIYLSPGDKFTARPMTFVALNHEMRMQRPLLVELLGIDFAPWSPDKLMIEAAKGLGNVLITGETGCEHEQLARAIHAMSLVRNRLLITCTAIPVERDTQTALVKQAARSTLILPLNDKMRGVDPTFASLLFSRAYRVRVIVTASTQALARRLLPREAVDQMQHVWIRPIAVRAGELPTLLDRLLCQRGAPKRFADLTGANQERFRRHPWRKNWEELRVAADRLAAIARTPSWEVLAWRERAAAIGVAKSTLVDWHKTLKLSKPLYT
ncbi:MAG: hypothetical protein E6J90_40875 [Deltaproteobacteria bacterium]|nr:MAG: hypothetical protein E6J90_40875 [Deltaproteobacteria bacterium]